MNYGVLSEYQRKIFWLAVGLAALLHVCVVAALILMASGPAEEKYKALAVMDFAYYDPDGGEPGGSDAVEPLPEPAAAEQEPEPVPEEPTPPEPEPEPEPEPMEVPDVVTTTSEEAAPAPAPPPVKEEVKPKPKRKPAPAKSKASDADASTGELKPGGGPGTGQGGVGGGTGKGNPNALKAYTSKIRAKLNRLKKYPSAAAAKRLEGIVTVNFTVDRGGNVTASRMVKSSGHPVLDQEAMALLKRCSPFPAMPKEMTQSTLTLTVPIQFKSPR